MRLLAACVLVALAASSAHGFKYTKERKGDGVSCNTPISRVGCKVDPDGGVIGLYFSAWGPPPDGANDVPPPYVLEGDSIAFTNNWCNEWGWRGRCATGSPSGSNTFDFGGATLTTPGDDATFSEWNIPYLTSMEVCYGKKSVKGVRFTATNYDTQWVLVDGKPIATVAPSGDTSEDTCGTFDEDTKCLFRQTFTAPEGKVLGSFGGKCKYSQGWFKYVSNGQYKERYTLEKVEKACVTDPVPPPIGLFDVCQTCIDAGLTPNDEDCSDFATYQCGDCKKK